MELHRLSYRNSTIGYYRLGSGPEKVICFHGYGEDASAFDFLGRLAVNQFTFYSIDLPFHGKTVWNEGLNFSNDDLGQIIELIISGNDSDHKPVSGKITLIGFSLGGRVVLSLYQLMPERIKRMVLLAPDGLKINFWYWLSTQTLIGNKFFAFTMKHPWWFFALLKLLNSLGMVNASIFKFVNFYIGNKPARDLLYKRWTCLRKIKPNLLQIKSFIRQYDTIVRLVYGKHDRIILSVVGEKFRKGIEQQSSLSVIPSGHQILHEKHAEFIVQALQQ